MKEFEELVDKTTVGGWFQLTAANLGNMNPDAFHEFMVHLIGHGPNNVSVLETRELSDGTHRYFYAKVLRTS